MIERMIHGRLLLAAIPLLLAATPLPSRGVEEVTEVPLVNPTFTQGPLTNGLPNGWSLYAGNGKDQQIKVIDLGKGGKALLLDDGDTNAEIGLTQTVPVKPNLTYEARVKIRAVEGSSTLGAHIQLRFLPSNYFEQTSFGVESKETFEEVTVKATAPADTTSAVLYLYTHRDPTPKVLFKEVRLVSGVEPPPPPPPAPIPPQYTKLKDLRLTTELVRDGKPNVTLLVPASGLYGAEAKRLQQAIAKITRVTVPIATDKSPAGAVPITGNLIVLGNRSTNKTLEELYNRYFVLTDLRYPGPEGYEVRTVHDPFGNGSNLVLVGGSDAAGVAGATAALITKLRQAGGKPGSLTLGWLMEIKLGKGVVVPKDLRAFETWEASRGYGSVGYFGWNSISKRMAMYYMTGDPFQAREALRLAFPDQQAFKEICDIDDERIENKDDPLAGPYHYNAHLMILFWDLIEESPVFSDEERLKVTNAFARQLNHRRDEGIYSLTQAPPYVGSRHGQWCAISLYCLGRYFNRDYPNPIWAQCVRGAELHFAPLHEDANIFGEADNLFWYCTGIAPVFTYMVLTGDRKPLENGVLKRLLRGQEVLISGRQPDWALGSAALDYLHKAAYLTQDGRYLTYRNRTGVDTSIFRLGQSFWPEDRLKPVPPTDLVGEWNVNYLTKSGWRDRQNGYRLEESFNNASFRSAAEASGDYLLLDGFNGASRNPYHTFDVLELRLAGNTILQGYWNQVLTKADGMVEPKVAMDGALRYHDVLGDTAVAVGAVPKAAFCEWQRSVVQRVGKYALFVDELTFRTDSDNIEAQIKWECGSGSFQVDPTEKFLTLQGFGSTGLPPGWKLIRSLDSKCTTNLVEPGSVVQLDALNITLLRAKEVGAWMEMPFGLKAKMTGEAYVDFLNYVDRGVVRMWLDGKPVGDRYDNYAAGVVAGRASLGRLELAPGQHRLRVEVIEKREASDKCYIGLTGLSIRPDGAAAAVGQTSAAEIRGADVLPILSSGSAVTQQWEGKVTKGQRQIFFSLVGMRPKESSEKLQCLRLADNAAALALPKPAVVVAGDWEGTQGDLVVIASDHIFGRGLTSASLSGKLLSASQPVNLEWNLTSGELNVVAAAQTRLSLAVAPLRLAAAGGFRLDDKPVAGNKGERGLTSFSLAPGRHHLIGFKLPAPALKELGKQLSMALIEAGDLRVKQLAPDQGATKPTTPSLTSSMSASVGGDVVDLIPIPSANGEVLGVAEGKTIHLLSPDGKEIRQMPTEGSIRVLRWWPEHQLLLAGCVDDKVIAFDLNGNRKWVFISEMDPAVFRAAKTYWFKTAPGHEGIHGLYTGTFLDGKSQAFVGSACTLEIIDENGKLLKRLPQFWGPVYKFAIVPATDGSLNLLASRKITDGPTCGVINNKTLDPNPRNFYSVPSTHSYVPGWMSETRYHIFHEDLDGDGKKEVISEITGSWNRVTVWNEQGDALYNVQFGPGDVFPARNIRDLDLGDLDGDGKKEVVAILSSGLVVMFTNHLEKVWAKRVSSPPTVVKVLNGSIVVGSEDGSVSVFDSNGSLIRTGKVNGRPTCIEALGKTALIATGRGEVKGFEMTP